MELCYCIRMKTYQGGCHCGAVRYNVKTELEKILECNCSHCEKKGLLLNFVPENQFTLLSGEDNLTDYQFNKRVIHHLFCKTCGVQSFARGMGKNGPTISINVRCLDGIDIKSLTLTPFDGKNW